MIPHIGYYDDYGDLNEDAEKLPEPIQITGKQPGSAKFDVKDVYEPLFTSATWALVASVSDDEGTHVVERSTSVSHPHDKQSLEQWARWVLRLNKDRLRAMGVEVTATYVRYGGSICEL